MPAGKYLTDFEKGQITTYRGSGESIKEIATLIKRSPTVVRNFFYKKENYGIKKY